MDKRIMSMKTLWPRQRFDFFKRQRLNCALKIIKLFMRIVLRPPAYQRSPPRPKNTTHTPDGDPINEEKYVIEGENEGLK